MSRKFFWSIFAIGLGLRLAGMLVAPALWYDESFTMDVACLSWPRMMAAISGDVHPPLWYAIEWMMCHAMPSMPYWAIRLPALALGLLAIWLAWKLTRRMKLAGIVQKGVTVMMAVQPSQLWYSTEGRMYTLLECGVLLATLAMLNRRWLWLGITFAVMAYTQNYGLLFSAGVATAGVIIRPRDWKYIAMAGAGAALSWAPWAATLLQQMQIIHGNYWIMPTTVGSVLYLPLKITWMYGLPEATFIPAALMTWTVILLGAIMLVKQAQEFYWLPLVMVMVPVVLSLVISWTWQDMFLDRAFMGIAPFLYMIVAHVANLINTRRGWLLLLVFVVPVAVASIGGFYKAHANKGGNTDMVMNFLRENVRPGDVIVHSDDGTMVNMYRQPYTQYRLPDCEPVRGGLSTQTRAALGVPEKRIEDIHATRIWLFYSQTGLHPACYAETMQAIIGQSAPVMVIEDSQFIHAGIWLLEENR